MDHAVISSDIGMLSIRRQAIIWTIYGVLSMGLGPWEHIWLKFELMACHVYLVPKILIKDDNANHSPQHRLYENIKISISVDEIIFKW